MTKNIIVLDEFGNELGTTYPKRAKGLMKNGRAEIVNDETIRLTGAHDPTVIKDVMEEINMGEIINFNTREFKFDKTNQGVNVGSRMFVTDSFGETVEVFEIGNGSDAWTQIACEKVLEKNTDYVFRFAYSRKADNGVSQLIIVPHDSEETTDEDWENRYVFNLMKGEFKPSINKNIDGKNVRVYEIPFNTYDCNNFRFVFVNQFSSARIYPARELEAYKDFPDGDKSFFEETKSQFENMTKDFDVNQTISDASAIIKQVAEKIAASAKNVFSGNSEENDMKMYKCHNFEGKAFEETLNELGNNSKLKLYACNIGCEGNTIDPGSRADGFKAEILGCNLSGQSFHGIADKIGDGSEANISGNTIGSYAGNSISHGAPAENVYISLNGSVIAESSFAKLLSVVGSGKIDLQGTVIKEEYGNFYYGNEAGTIDINASNAVIPDKILGKLHEKLGTSGKINK